MSREFEVRAVDNSKTLRVLAEDEAEAAETAAPLLPEGAEAYVYPAELPVGWEGDDAEEPSDDPRGPNPV